MKTKVKKIVTCKNCGTEFEYGTKKCPNCNLKQKKPIYKRGWFIFLIILVVCSVITGSCGGDDETREKLGNMTDEQWEAYNNGEIDIDGNPIEEVTKTNEEIKKEKMVKALTVDIGLDEELAKNIATILNDVGVKEVTNFELSSGDNIDGLCRYATTANDIEVEDLELCFEKGEMYAIKIKGYDLYTKDDGIIKQITDIAFWTDKQKKENPYLVDDENITFEEIYLASQDENPLVFAEKYVGNRYRVVGKINGMTNKGLANLTGGATLTLETKVGNTTVFFWAEFEKEETEKLKQLKDGDTVTFVGTCYGGDWEDCVLVTE